MSTKKNPPIAPFYIDISFKKLACIVKNYLNIEGFDDHKCTKELPNKKKIRSKLWGAKKGSGYFVKEAEAWQNQDRTYKYFRLFSLFLNF